MTPATHEQVRGPLLWIGVSAGIALWAVHLNGMAALTPYVCHSGNTIWFHALSVGTLIPTLLAAIPCWRAWRSEGGLGGVQYLGAVGVLLNAIFALAIIAEWVPVFMIDSCLS